MLIWIANEWVVEAVSTIFGKEEILIKMKKLFGLLVMCVLVASFVVGCAKETTSSISAANKKIYLESCEGSCKEACKNGGAAAELCNTKCEEACKCSLDNMAKIYPNKSVEEFGKLEAETHQLANFCIKEMTKGMTAPDKL